MNTRDMITLGFVAAACSGLVACRGEGAPADSDVAVGAADVQSLGQPGTPALDREVTPLRLASGPPPPTPADVYIESITTGGAGCPDPSTVSTLISSDRASFLVIFDEMILEYPPKPYVKNINCVAGVKLHIPSGWQFTIATITTRGYAFLSNGIKARQTSKYFFAGLPVAAAFHTQLNGLFDDTYSFTDTIGISSQVWSPCGGSAIFAIDTSLNLNAIGNTAGSALFNAETLDGVFQKIMHWQWQQC